MAEIIPSILVRDYEELKNKIALVRGLVPSVQIDICDGIFVPSRTWPFASERDADPHFKKILNEEEGMPFWEDIDFELDLLVKDAVENFDIYAKLGPKAVVFHMEAVGDEKEFRNFLESIDNYVRDSINFGLALSPATPNEEISSLVPLIDFVQFMGNDKIGYQGVGIELDEKVYEKIKSFREKFPDMSAAVDIGVNEETAPKLIDAGATKLIIGSAIFRADDIIEKIEEFKNL